MNSLSLASSTFVCIHCGLQHAYNVAACPGTGKPLIPSHKLQGRMLEGKYSVGRVIAEGGMGIVYEGTHLEIGRKVAIKFLHSAVAASPEMVERFRNEARIAAAVGHRNIVSVLDMGTTTEGVPYIVMEHLEGSDLGDFLDAAVRLPRPWAVDIAIQILSALRPVHVRKVVHRDLKPANILLVNEPDGSVTVKLLDFGVSRLMADDLPATNRTRDGAVFGTPRYMSPEQARGARDLDHRADLYSVGVILYRMLTGAFPFEAETPQALLPLIVNNDPLPVGRHGVPIPAGLEAVVMWALARDASERFQDADEFIEALMPYRDTQVEGEEATDDSSSPAPGSSGPGWGESTPISQQVERIEARGSRHTPDRLGSPSNSSIDETTLKPEVGVSYSSLVVEQIRASAAESPTVAGAVADPLPEVLAHGGPKSPPARVDPSSVATGAVEPVKGTVRVQARAKAGEKAGEKAGARSSGEVAAVLAAALPPPAPVGGVEIRVGAGASRGRRRTMSPLGRSRIQTLLLSTLVVLALAVMVLVVLETGRLDRVMGAVATTSGGAAPVAIAEGRSSPASGVWKIAVEGLPPGAEVLVDGVLHPEQPLVVTGDPGPRRIRITAPGHFPWERKVMVACDFALAASLDPIP